MDSPLTPPLTACALLKKLHQLHAAKHYAVAVSGGPDSMALLALVAQAAGRENAPRFSVLTVNHGLRPAGENETQMVVAAAQKLGLCGVALAASPPFPSSGIQNWARQTRYALMAAWCKKHKADGLLLAHHLDDQAETILMRINHKSGADGMAGMAEKQTLMTQNGALILLRPVLAYPRTALHAMLPALETMGLAPIADPTNENANFERVRWRQRLPALAQAGVAPKKLAALGAQFRSLRRQGDRLAAAWFQHYGKVSDFGYLSLCRKAFVQSDSDLQHRLLRRLVQLLAGRHYPPATASIVGLCRHIMSCENGAHNLAGCLVRWRSRQLMLGREGAVLANTPPMRAKTDWQNWDGRFAVRLSDKKCAKNSKTDIFIAPLGAQGLKAAKSQKAKPHKSLPAAYLYVLPAFFDASGLRACPILQPKKGFETRLADNFVQFVDRIATY